MNFKLGADPELFVGNSSGVKSIIGKIGGTKESPFPLPLGDGFAVQEDNVAMEFNIPAADTQQNFTGYIKSVLDFLGQVIHDSHQLHIVKDSAISFPVEELMDPAAMVFGCDPDYNAWTNTKNPRPMSEDKTLRSCGGHVHIGVKADKETKRRIVQACDLFLSVPAVFMDQGVLRKKLYGKAGACRYKSYGVEYRTMSNFWIFDPRLCDWVWNQVGLALAFVEEGRSLDDDAELIIEAINTNNENMAQHLINKYDLKVI